VYPLKWHRQQRAFDDGLWAATAERPDRESEEAIHYTTRRMKASSKSPARQFAGFLARFSPAVRAVARAAMAKMRTRMPGAVEIVYDNYYALVVGFGPNERPSDAVFSLAIYPRHVTLCFLFGVELDDPKKLLQGDGNQIRHIRLAGAATLDEPEVQALIAQAIEGSEVPFDRKARRRMIIRMISAKQRPRRVKT
jgi:hypothetical protein